MRNLILFFAMAFSALAIDLSAQTMLDIKQSESGKLTIDVPTKTVGKVDAELVRLYGEDNVLNAWKADGKPWPVVTSDTKIYQNWGLQENHIIFKIFLAKKGEAVTTDGGGSASGGLKIAWLTLINWLITIILGLLFLRTLAKSNLIAVHNLEWWILLLIVLVTYVVAYVSYKLSSPTDEYIATAIMLGIAILLTASFRRNRVPVMVLPLGIPIGIFFWIGNSYHEWPPFIINGVLLIISITVGCFMDIKKVRAGRFYNPSLGN
jgi:hypothetical protein